jgi:predicted amidophosphoribosyltransferase
LLDLSTLAVQPAGFGSCGSCPYRDTGSAAICYACAASTIEPVSDSRCEICDQRLADGAACTNYWCRQSDDVRAFGVVFAIAMRTGMLERAINRYKYEGMTGWAGIFGRVVIGYLDEHARIFQQYDRILGIPGFVGDGARRSFDHVALILDAARVEDVQGWPIQPSEEPLIVKTAETPSMVKLSGAWERREMAATTLRDALHVPSRPAVAGLSILAFDDVFTDGTTLREVARKLRAAGATRVDGLALARQPWRW